MSRDPLEKWTLQDARDLYNVRNWGKGYFSVNKRGCVAVHPYKDPEQFIDLKELVDQLKQRGIELPILLRFTDILRHRIGEMHDAFMAAISECDYKGKYCCVYPIKVNQQRQVVDEFLDFGKPYGFGLECGSKPELLAVLALTHRSDIPVICNGFKDDDYIEMVVFSQKIGKTVIPVIEKFNELELILRYAEKLSVRPVFGVRVKLSARGAGRWKLSGGDRSKFGLTVTELLKIIEILKQEGKADCCKLLHFHLGSQITNIHSIKNAITEVSRIYVELSKAGAGLEILDVGGGLGIDYDGSQTNFESSVNYTLQEYANDIIFRLKTICDEANVKHPMIISESGRATVAYHSVLVFNVLGISKFHFNDIPEEIPEDYPQPIHDLHALAKDLSKKNLLESYHDAVQSYDELINLFNLGYLSLELRSLSERLYYHAAQKILRIVRNLDFVPEELEGLEAQLSDTYFCNFSVFQSLPDSWAVQQLFPIMPIHRLREEPRRRGILADITCDSDGKVDKFIDLRDVKKTLELHDCEDEEYYLAAFLVGAYQEILGDLHNLFGDTNSVHVSLDENGNINVDTVVKGDTVQQVLSYVQYSAGELISKIRKDVESALREKRITLEESARFLKFYEQGMGSYTYLISRPQPVLALPQPGGAQVAAATPVAQVAPSPSPALPAAQHAPQAAPEPREPSTVPASTTIP
jgi:arginine decarboxylase